MWCIFPWTNIYSQGLFCKKSGLIVISPCLCWALKTILNGKESSFLPQKCKANLPHPGKESCFLPRMLKVHPSLRLSFSKCNSTLPHRGKDSSIFKMQSLHKSFPTNYFMYLYFSFLFNFIYLFIYFFFLFLFFVLFHYYLNFDFFFFFPKTWNSSPKWKSYSPAFGGNNRRIDAHLYHHHSQRNIPQG